MAAAFPTPPVKRPQAAFPGRRGRVKAQIFGEIAESLASAASRAGNFLGLIKKDDDSAPAGLPKTTETSGG
ncbi:hypothetical protein R6Q59_036855 [Mikania micrantha]|uniref:Uncharacterized protein n=1 Tax=Mikania micrantha TaxID=192012 RepID=A0A5N6NM61_9ASTR|nr:hypothetical protein E3N88_18555 [Mikania micrantha]